MKLQKPSFHNPLLLKKKKIAKRQIYAQNQVCIQNIREGKNMDTFLKEFSKKNDQTIWEIRFVTPSLLPKMSQIKGMKKLGFKNDPLPPFRTKVLNFALYFF